MLEEKTLFGVEFQQQLYALRTSVKFKCRRSRNGSKNWTRNTTLYSGFVVNGKEGSDYLSLHCIARYVENMKTKYLDLEISPVLESKGIY